jgi:SAM-dependent methyltransferase
MPKHWYEDENFWNASYQILFPEESFKQAFEQVDDLISLLKPEPYSHVLDLCCGVGRHSLELAQRGFKVTGVDLTEKYLDEAKKKSKKKGLKIEFVHEDMRKFVRPDSFDFVINMFTSFGYFEKLEDDKKVARNIYKSIKKGGKFLIDMTGKEILSRIFRERDWYEIEGTLVLEERKLKEYWSGIETRWIMFKDDKRKEVKFSLRLYSAVELINLLKECGFGEVEVYGDLKGASYDNRAKRLVAVAKK